MIALTESCQHQQEQDIHLMDGTGQILCHMEIFQIQILTYGNQIKM